MTSPATHRCASRPWTVPAAPHLGRLDLDSQLVIRCFDAGFAALAGEHADEVLGRPLAALFSARDRRDAAQFDELVHHGSVDRLDLTIVLRLGAREVLSRLLLSRTDVGWLAFIEDQVSPPGPVDHASRRDPAGRQGARRAHVGPHATDEQRGLRGGEQAREGRHAPAAAPGRAGDLVADLVVSRELWREVVHRSAEGVAVLDGDGRLLEYNPAFVRLLDLRSARGVSSGDDALRGRALVDLLRGDSLAPLREHLAGRHSGEPALYHRGRWLEFTARPLALPRQRFAGAWLSLRDVSDRRRAERLEAAAERIEPRRQQKLVALGGLVESVAQAVGTPLHAAVAAAMRTQDQLHELQASFEAGILRQRDMRDHLRLALDAADTALANVRRAASLVAGVAQLAVDGAGHARKDMSVGTYVNTVVAGLGPLFGDALARVRVELRADPVVALFPAALAQIVTNLVHGALRPGRAGRVVVWVDHVGDQVELGCRDDGAIAAPRPSEPGLPPAGDGDGLDLYIVHTLVTDLLGGTVVARATPDRGTSVVVRFPARPPRAP